MFRNLIYRIIYSISKRFNSKLNFRFNDESFASILQDRKQSYAYFHHYFWNLAPDWLINHRLYYKQKNRGFGEDAFHAMWLYIFEKYAIKSALEIGIYRGQIISLWELIALKINKPVDIVAISPFTSAGDQVSLYASDIDYFNDTLQNFDHFELTYPTFIKGYSTDNDVLDQIKGSTFDLIYIDGNHDYEVVKSDFLNFSKLLNENGLIILDDSALYTTFDAPIYASKGHSGPSKLANEIDKELFTEILSVGHNRVFQKK